MLKVTPYFSFRSVSLMFTVLTSFVWSIRKLQSQSDTVKEELIKLFGDGLNFDIEVKPQTQSSNQATVIALGVLLGLSLVGLIITAALFIWWDLRPAGFNRKCIRLSSGCWCWFKYQLLPVSLTFNISTCSSLRFKVKEKHRDSDKESFDISRNDESYT